jgi:hypothetical protein
MNYQVLLISGTVARTMRQHDVFQKRLCVTVFCICNNGMTPALLRIAAMMREWSTERFEFIKSSHTLHPSFTRLTGPTGMDYAFLCVLCADELSSCLNSGTVTQKTCQHDAFQSAFV